MLVEESMHIAFDETNQNMQENSKTSADDEFPNIQQADIGCLLYTSPSPRD